MNGDSVRPELLVLEKIRKENGGPCRGRTYGPLIKSGECPIWQGFVVAKVSPTSVIYRVLNPILQSRYLILMWTGCYGF